MRNRLIVDMICSCVPPQSGGATNSREFTKAYQKLWYTPQF